MTERKGYGARALAALLPKIAEPAMRRRGFTAAEIVTRWENIVGASLAADCAPERISFPQGARMDGTLHILASGPLALELQHMEPVLVERINTFCGYRAVTRIAIKQTPRGRVKNDIASKRRPAPDPARVAAVESRTRGIGDEKLRTALNRLGTAVNPGENGHK